MHISQGGAALEGTMQGLPWLPEAPHIVFEHPPLALALCQLGFPSVLDVADNRFVARFHRAIKDQYPITTTAGEQVEVEVSVGPSGPQIKEVRSPQWRFADRSDTWSVVLTQSYLTLETRKYKDFDHFLQRFDRLLRALVKHIKPALGTRLGLRYVNEVRVSNQPWASVIRPELMGPLAVPGLIDNIYQTIQEVQFNLPDSYRVTLRHGLFPGGTTVQPAAGVKMPVGPFYLLDFDVFREFHLPEVLPIEPETICQHVAQYNTMTRRLFHWSLTEEYISSLGIYPH